MPQNLQNYVKLVENSSITPHINPCEQEIYQQKHKH
jgi:hypothetical protein